MFELAKALTEEIYTLNGASLYVNNPAKAVENNPGGRYVVGGVVPSLVLETFDYEPDIFMSVSEWLHFSAVDGKLPASVAGSWFDEETNSMVVDLSTLHGNLSTALDKARSRGEKAIFDLKTRKEIKVPKGLTLSDIEDYTRLTPEITRETAPVRVMVAPGIFQKVGAVTRDELGVILHVDPYEFN